MGVAPEMEPLLSHQFPSTVELSPQQHGPHQPVGRHYHGHENRPAGAAAGLIRAILDGTFRAEIG